MTIEVGRTHELDRVVTPELSAHAMGNEGVHVLATPNLVMLFEACSVRAIQDALEPGQATVGTHLDVRHLAATPIGDTVRIRAELIEVAGKRLVFHVEGFDSAEKIGEGRHERYVVDLGRFLARVQEKADVPRRG